ncbi:hypothetical protein [Leucobacter chironomi]|uniref:hypothetical protein n=1 Tax=Leucobacter chironomi TaxID=491918 RepID=UPI0012691FFC|nr:hypothetical protein [Leucobacter chironomi]
MSTETEAGTLPLWGEDRPNSHQYGEGPTETAVREAVEAINAEKPLDASQRARAQICRSLAKNIDAGNTKGRAVANEAQQLDTMLDALRGVADTASDSEGIPEDVRQLFELGTVPTRHDAAEVRDPEMP